MSSRRLVVLFLMEGMMMAVWMKRGRALDLEACLLVLLGRGWVDVFADDCMSLSLVGFSLLYHAVLCLVWFLFMVRVRGSISWRSMRNDKRLAKRHWLPRGSGSGYIPIGSSWLWCVSKSSLCS